MNGDGNNAGDASSAFSALVSRVTAAASGNTCTDSNGTSVGDSTSQETCRDHG